jgi:anti-repressor protein
MEEVKVINEQLVMGKDFRMYGTIESPLFLAKDVATWIEHSNVSMMLQKIDDDEKGIRNVYTLGGNQDLWFLTEDGLYEVLMQSRKPIAKAFKKEVKEVLKTIRKNGGYVQENNEEKFIDSYFPSLSDETKIILIKDLQKTVLEMKPKAETYDLIMSSDGTFSMNQVAKIVGMEDLGEYKLFEFLRKKGILFLENNQNVPYKSYRNRGLFKVVLSDENPKKAYSVTRVYPKGVEFITKLVYTSKKLAI